MKIKSDFVTNSSSTSYVVFIPPNFEIDDEFIIKNISDYDDIYDEDIPEFIINVRNILDNIKNGNTVDAYDNEHVFYTVINIIDKKGFILRSFSSGSDDESIITIPKDKIENLILSYTTNIDII